MQIQGGPPAPQRWCANCDGELKGRLEHRKDDHGNLFCNELCKGDYLVRTMNQKEGKDALLPVQTTVWLGS